MEDWQNFLELLLRHAPIYLVLIMAAVFVIARWDRHPSASFFAMLGFGWLILFGLVSDVWQGFQLYAMVTDEIVNAPGDDLEWVLDGLSCAFFSAVQSVGFVFLLMAICSGRPSRHDAYRFAGDEPADAHHHS